MFAVSLDLDEAAVADLGQRAEAVVGRACRIGVDRGLDAGVVDARTNHRHKDKSGFLTGSIGGRIISSDNAGTEAVFEATAGYASHVEEGTAPHEIVPRRARSLHWDNGGADVFAGRVEHPGTEPLPFMEPAAATVERVAVDTIERETVAGLQELLSG